MFRERQDSPAPSMGLPEEPSFQARTLEHDLPLTIPSRVDLARLVVVGIAYFVLAYVGLQLASIHPNATPIWPPTGLAIAAILLWGYRCAPAIFVAAFLVNQLFAGSTLTSLAIACGNTLEAATAVYLIRSLAGDGKVFETPTHIAKFFLACLVATPISAAIGVSSLTLGGHADASNFLPIWFTWWSGDLAGALIVAPVVVLWVESEPASFTRSEVYRTTATYIVSAMVGLICFSPVLPQNEFRDALGFLVVLPLLWAAVREGPRDTVTVALIISAFAVWGTLFQGGPFIEPSQNGSFMVLVIFLISIAMPALALSAEVSARRGIEKKARQHSLKAEVLWQATLQVAAGGSFDRLLRTCLQRICEVTGWTAGHVYMPDDINDPHLLRSSSVWHFKRAALDSLAHEAAEVELSPGQGLPGRIWATGKPEWISDISKCKNLDRKQVLLRHGFRAAFGFPIYTEGKLQAVLEFFSTARQPPDKDLLCVVQSIGEQLGRVIERKRAQEQQAALETTLNALTLAVYFTDNSGRIVYMNRAAKGQIGAGSGLHLENNRLVPIDRTARLAFARALNLATANNTRLPTNETIIPLPAKNDVGLIAVILPLEGSELKSVCGAVTAAAAILVQDSVTIPLSTGAAFANLYGLTRSELRVLLAMAPGLSTKQVAETLGICEATAKTHLQHIYAKTGTSKQTELMHLFMSSAPPVHDLQEGPDGEAKPWGTQAPEAKVAGT